MIGTTIGTPVKVLKRSGETSRTGLVPCCSCPTVGSSETIAFNETPSSGFRWQPEMAESTNASIVTVTDDGYPADQAVRPGSTRSHRWIIEARSPGTAKIVFVHSRHWEHKPPIDTYTLQIKVTAAR